VFEARNRRARGALAARAALCLFAALAVSAPSGAAALKDPTRPPGYAAGGGRASHRPAWVLSQTLISPGRRLATINGRRVSVGEWVRGAVVVEILPTEVKLRRKHRTFSIKLLPGRVKRPAR